MKYFLLLATIPFMAAKCEKKITDDCLQGKVIRITCASTVIQITNRTDIGTDNWKNGFNNANETYDNVFSVTNKCQLSPDLKVGDQLSFTIEKPKPTDCIVCMMYDAPPDAQYHVVTGCK